MSSIPPISQNIQNVVQKAPFSDWMQKKYPLLPGMTGSPLDLIVCGIRICLVVGYGNECRKALMYKKPSTSTLFLQEERTLVERIESGSYTAVKSIGSFAQLLDQVITLGWITVKKVIHVVTKILGHLTGVVWFAWDAVSDLLDIQEVEDLSSFGEEIKYSTKKDFYHFKLARYIDFFAKFFLSLHSGFELGSLFTAAVTVSFSELFLIIGVSCFVLGAFFQMSDTSSEKIEYLRGCIPASRLSFNRKFVYRG